MNENKKNENTKIKTNIPKYTIDWILLIKFQTNKKKYIDMQIINNQNNNKKYTSNYRSNPQLED